MNNRQLLLIPALLAAGLAMAADPAKIDWGDPVEECAPVLPGAVVVRMGAQ